MKLPQPELSGIAKALFKDGTSPLSWGFWAFSGVLYLWARSLKAGFEDHGVLPGEGVHLQLAGPSVGSLGLVPWAVLLQGRYLRDSAVRVLYIWNSSESVAAFHSLGTRRLPGMWRFIIWRFSTVTLTGVTGMRSIPKKGCLLCLQQMVRSRLYRTYRLLEPTSCRDQHLLKRALRRKIPELLPSNCYLVTAT